MEELLVPRGVLVLTMAAGNQSSCGIVVLTMRIGIRWTVGNVSNRGFETLSLPIQAATHAFGAEAEYTVCVNTIDIRTARERTGPAADLVTWRDVAGEVPPWLSRSADSQMAEGVAWKFAPADLYRDRPTLALDNDVILWSVPPSVRAWYEDTGSFLIAEDVAACYGSFAAWCPPEPRNSGIRGVPAGFLVGDAVREMLERTRMMLRSETDEQGLQVALVSARRHHVVRTHEVSICGYFRPHSLQLGTDGAHFVGVNSRRLPWEWAGRNGAEWVHGFWDGMKNRVRDRMEAVRLEEPATRAPGGYY